MKEIALAPGPRDFHSKSRYLAKSETTAYIIRDGHEGRQTNRRCFEVRGAMVLLCGHPGISSQSVTQASSGYQAVCCSVA